MFTSDLLGRKQKRGEVVSQRALWAAEPLKAVFQWIYVLCPSCYWPFTWPVCPVSSSYPPPYLQNLPPGWQEEHSFPCSISSSSSTPLTATQPPLPNTCRSLRRLLATFLAYKGQKGGLIVTEDKWSGKSKYWKLLSLIKLLRHLSQ